jgi:hypothetical protein
MEFHADVSIGDILTALAFVLTLWSFHQANKKKLTEGMAQVSLINYRVRLMWNEFKKRFDIADDENGI